MITKSTQIKAKKTFTRQVGDSVYIFNSSTGKIFQLNETGSVIWNQLARPTTITRLATTLTQEFEISLSEALKDCVELIKKLEKLGYITVIK